MNTVPFGEPPRDTMHEPPGRAELWPKRAVWLLLATAVLVILFILVRDNWVAIERYQAAELATGKAAKASAANQLAVTIYGLVQSVDLFAQAHSDALQSLAGARPGSPPEAEQRDRLEARLQAQLRTDLPEALGFELDPGAGEDRDAAAHLATRQTDVADFLSYRRGGTIRELIWHPQDERTHFDVLVSLDTEPGRRFVVSFGIETLRRILHSAEPAGHRLMVLRRDLSGDAEVILTGQGLPDADTDALLSQLPESDHGEAVVLGSRWQVVDVPDDELLSGYRNRQLLSAAGLFLLVLLTLAASALVLSRQVRRLERHQQALTDRNERLQHRSLHDPLTGLPNRLLLEERLGQRAVESSRSGRRFALMVLDLDRFKQINTSFGRWIGDRILLEVGDRIRDLLRDDDTVARVGDDEFALLVTVDSRQQAEVIAAKVLDRLDAPFELEGSPISISANLGIALFPDHGRDSAELLMHAELAMQRARGSGEQTAIYQPADDPESPDRLSLLAGLRDAIREDQLYLEYQPKVECQTRDRSRAEALVRWQHPVHGRLAPDEFLPLVEQTDTIVQLTHWVVEEALRTLQQFGDEHAEAKIAVNLSARVLHRDEFPLWVDRKLAEYGVAAGRLSFEVTESAIMKDSEKALGVLLTLTSIGCSISVDDFGIGYSSLAYLSRLPVSELKIDRSFVSGMMSYEGDRSIVRAIIDLAHDLRLQVVAEGVEVDAQVRALHDLGCDLMQGYGISPPLNAAELRQWLTEPA